MKFLRRSIVSELTNKLFPNPVLYCFVMCMPLNMQNDAQILILLDELGPLQYPSGNFSQLVMADQKNCTRTHFKYSLQIWLL